MSSRVYSYHHHVVFPRNVFTNYPTHLPNIRYNNDGTQMSNNYTPECLNNHHCRGCHNHSPVDGVVRNNNIQAPEVNNAEGDWYKTLEDYNLQVTDPGINNIFSILRLQNNPEEADEAPNKCKQGTKNHQILSAKFRKYEEHNISTDKYTQNEFYHDRCVEQYRHQTKL